jgi:hypothetical protein
MAGRAVPGLVREMMKAPVDPMAELFSALSVVRAHKAIRGAVSDMSDNYIIEVGSQAAGIVVRNPGGYCFFAASHRFNQMEGQLFRNAREAERAAIRLANGELKQVA